MKKKDKFLIADKEIFDKLLHTAIHTKMNAPKKRAQASASLPEGALGMAIVHKDTTKKKD